MDFYVVCYISDSSIWLKDAQSRLAQKFLADISQIYSTSNTRVTSSNLNVGDILKYNQYYFVISTPNRIYKTLDYSSQLSIPKHITQKFPRMRSFFHTWPSFDTVFIYSLIDYVIFNRKPQILNSLKTYIQDFIPHVEYFTNLMRSQSYHEATETIFQNFGVLLELVVKISSYFGTQYERICSITDVGVYFLDVYGRVTAINSAGSHKIYYLTNGNNYYLLYEENQALARALGFNSYNNVKISKKVNNKQTNLENSSIILQKMLESYNEHHQIPAVIEYMNRIPMSNFVKDKIEAYTVNSLCYECQQQDNLIFLPCNHRICLEDFDKIVYGGSSGRYVINNDLKIYCTKPGCFVRIENAYVEKVLPNKVKYSCSGCKDNVTKSAINVACGHLCDVCVVESIRSKEYMCKICATKFSEENLSYFRSIKKLCEECEEEFYWIKYFPKRLCKHLICIECVSESEKLVCFWKCPKFNISHLELKLLCKIRCEKCKTWYEKKEFYWMHKACECNICDYCQVSTDNNDSLIKCIQCSAGFKNEVVEYLKRKNVEVSQLPLRECGVCLSKFKINQIIELIACDHIICRPCFSNMTQEYLQDNSKVSEISKCFQCPEPIPGNQLEAILDPEYYEKYVYFILIKQFELTQCPLCKTEFEVYLSRKATCTNVDCRYSFCKTCKEDYHESGGCNEEFIQARIKELETIDEEEVGVTQCPSCRIPYLKQSSTCTHVDCLNPSCKASFCFKCACIRSPTLVHGNHYHRPQCQDYNDYNGNEDEFNPACLQCQKGGELCSRPKALRVPRKVAFDEIED